MECGLFADYRAACGTFLPNIKPGPRLEDLRKVEHNCNSSGKQATPGCPRALLTASSDWALDNGYVPPTNHVTGVTEDKAQKQDLSKTADSLDWKL